MPTNHFCNLYYTLISLLKTYKVEKWGTQKKLTDGENDTTQRQWYNLESNLAPADKSDIKEGLESSNSHVMKQVEDRRDGERRGRGNKHDNSVNK